MRSSILFVVMMSLAACQCGGVGGGSDGADELDAGFDAGLDDAGAEPDASVDGGGDAGHDAGVDAGSDDAGVHDAGMDDAGIDDAGIDAGSDGGADGGASSCITWSDRQSGTALDDEWLSLWGDETGITLGGYENGQLRVLNIDPAGDSRAVIEHYGLDGVLRWRRVVDTPGTDVIEDVLRDGDSVLALGRTTGALPGAVNAGQFDTFVVEIVGNNVPGRWLQTGTDRPQHPAKLGVLDGGALVFSGFDDMFVRNSTVIDAENGFAGSMAFGDTAPRWLHVSASLMNPDKLTGLAVDPVKGHVYTSGYEFFPDAVSLGGAVVWRRDADGTPVWHRQLVRANAEVHSLLIASSGELYAAGATGFPLGDGGVIGGVDAFLALLERDTGDVRWVTTLGTVAEDLVSAIVEGPGGDLYLAGTTRGSLPGYTNQGETDAFVMRLDGAGRLLKVWQTGTDRSDKASALWVDGCGTVVLAGSTAGTLVADGGVGRTDAFVMHLAP